MAYWVTALSGSYDIRLPQWGRCFWQAPSDGRLFLAFVSGTTDAYYISSSDSGVNWSTPQFMFNVDDFSVHNNFDVFMDPRDHVHTTFRYNGSGCYRFFGRVPSSDWSAASGFGVVPYMLAGDSGNAKGVQASLVVQEEPGPLGDVAGQYPMLKIAAKPSTEIPTSFYMGYPFNSGSLLEDPITGAVSAGSDGGWPQPMTRGGSAGEEFGVAWYSVPTNRIEVYEKSNIGGDWLQNFLASFSPIASGQVPFGVNPNMAIGSGASVYESAWSLVTSASGHEMWGTAIVGNSVRHRRLETITDGSAWTWESSVARSGIQGLPPGSSGTRCDFTFDDNNKTHLFFINRDTTGSRYAVSRFVGDNEFDSINGDETLDFSTVWPSGRVDLFEANTSNTGGKNNLLYWDNFKAVKHPRPPGVGHAKGIYLVTQGYVPTYPSGGILTVWNASESPAARTPFLQPYYRMDYTATSGTSNIFQGVVAQSIWTNIQNAFDEDPTTYALSANGSSITLAMDQIRHIDRIEVVGASFSSTSSLRDIGQIDVYASFDNTNFSHIGTMPSGNATVTRIRRFTTDITDSNTSITNMFTKLIDPFAARYIRLNWTTAYALSGRRIGEIRLFGPATTSGIITTSDHLYTFAAPASGTYTEEFVGRQGEMPNSSWTSYGDFTWGIAASGSWTATSDLPTAPEHPNYSGLVPSGLFNFLERSHGNGDGFAMQSTPARMYGSGTSGVLEHNIYIRSSRDIAFDIRVDPQTDDVVEFYTIGPFDTSPTGTLRYTTPPVAVDWETQTFNLNTAGDWTLRWVYRRNSAPEDNPVAIASAWVDNASGLNGMSINQVKGFLRGGGLYDTGVIHGYLNAKMTSAINGYLYGAAHSGTINGYLPSAVSPDVVTSINGYLKGTGMSIHGYLLGSSGIDVTAYPTGAIHGYVLADLPSGVAGLINGYVHATSREQVIHGYLGAGSEVPETGAILGYVAGNNVHSTIHGLVNGSGENYTTTSIHGLVDARFGQGDQVIHGYVSVASGHMESIWGYNRCWDETSSFFMDPQTMIWGYLFGPPTGVSIHGYVRAIMPFSSIHGYLGSQALVASGGGLIGGGPGGGGSSTSNVSAGTNWIHGYLKGYNGDQMIHGYLMGPLGGISSIHGYTLGGVEDNQINGFVVGAEAVSGVINGYASGSLGSSSSINGYAFGSSGIYSNHILGFANGHTEYSSSIHGILIGVPASTGTNSKTTCISHTFPLAAVPTYTGIPTVFLNP
jgi:hypothetical protein